VMPSCRFLPTGRKTAPNSLDNTLGLVISLVWRQGAGRGALAGLPAGKSGGKSQVLRAEENDKLKILRICW
jgi:hypothetical protein